MKHLCKYSTFVTLQFWVLKKSGKGYRLEYLITSTIGNWQHSRFDFESFSKGSIVNFCCRENYWHRCEVLAS
jgi:hypothetical protein